MTKFIKIFSQERNYKQLDLWLELLVVPLTIGIVTLLKCSWRLLALLHRVGEPLTRCLSPPARLGTPSSCHLCLKLIGSTRFGTKKINKARQYDVDRKTCKRQVHGWTMILTCLMKNFFITFLFLSFFSSLFSQSFLIFPSLFSNFSLVLCFILEIKNASNGKQKGSKACYIGINFNSTKHNL